MNGISPVKHGFVDLAAVFFVVGGVVSLLMNLLAIPISSIYPFTLPATLSTSSLVVLGISLICSFGAIHCYSLARKRALSEAGIRGIIFGALLLIFSLGLVGSFRESNTSTSLTALSAVLILIAGAICFGLRHTMTPTSDFARQQGIPQPAYQSQSSR
jgi:hypothetical protein